MIATGMHGHLPASHEDVKHDLVAPRVPRQHRLQPLRKAVIAAGDPHVQQLPARHGQALRVVPQPRHVGHHGGRLHLGLHLGLDRRT